MTGCVVLCAGASSRMGAPKALLDAGDGRSFLQTIVETALAAGARGIALVVGPPHADEILRGAPALLTVAHNAEPQLGMLSSIKVGVAALPPEIEATLIWPVDVPAVAVGTVRAILAAQPGKLVIPTFGGRGGHPVRVGRDRFAELLALDPALGLRALVQARPAEVVRLLVDDPAVLVDVDTPEELRRLHRGD